MNITKEKKVNDILRKLKKIIDKSLLKSNYDTALAGIIASANIKYLSIPHSLWCGRPSHAFCGDFCSNIFCGVL